MDNLGSGRSMNDSMEPLSKEVPMGHLATPVKVPRRRGSRKASEEVNSLNQLNDLASKKSDPVKDL